MFINLIKWQNSKSRNLWILESYAILYTSRSTQVKSRWLNPAVLHPFQAAHKVEIAMEDLDTLNMDDQIFAY